MQLLFIIYIIIIIELLHTLASNIYGRYYIIYFFEIVINEIINIAFRLLFK